MRRLYSLLFSILLVGLIAKPCCSEEAEIDGDNWEPWREDMKLVCVVGFVQGIEQTILELYRSFLAPLTAGNVSLIISLIALVVSLCSLRWHRYRYLADMWYRIKEMYMDYPNFRDPEKTKIYKENFSDEEMLRYETLAELCWGYAEDLWLNGYAKKKFYIPTLKEFKRLHQNWLNDNKSAYSKRMVKFIDKLQNV